MAIIEVIRVKENKSIWIITIISIIAVISILGGIILLFRNQTPTEEEKSARQLWEERQKKARNIDQTRCYQELCVEEVKVIHDGDKEGGTAEFIIKNVSNETVEEKRLRIVFDNGESFAFKTTELLPQETNEIGLTYDEMELKTTEDFQLIEDTENPE